MYQEALDSGFLPIPVEYKGKRALIKWKRWVEYRPPLALIKSTFEKYDDCNMGILCGEPSDNLVVLDFDRPLPYYKWRDKYPKFAESMTVETSRGYHVYFRLGDLPHKTFHRDGCDIKASGYVIAPPSVHPSGYSYSPILGDTVLECETIADLGFEIEEDQPDPRAVIEDGELANISMFDGPSLIKAIKSRISILELVSYCTDKIRKTSNDGVWFIARCPFHNDRNPSMWVNTRWGRCKCYAGHCKASKHTLDVVDFYALLNGNITIKQAVNDLAFMLHL